MASECFAEFCLRPRLRTALHVVKNETRAAGVESLASGENKLRSTGEQPGTPLANAPDTRPTLAFTGRRPDFHYGSVFGVMKELFSRTLQQRIHYDAAEKGIVEVPPSRFGGCTS